VSVRLFYDPHRVEQLRTKGIAPRRQLPAADGTAATTATSPQSALDLVEENARLRADNRRLADEVARLTEELRRTHPPHADREEKAIDDSARRFALLELE
jgi:uncharacterized protein YlxW (UPF0749 family)